MSFLLGRKKTQELSGFERRQSMAMKLERQEMERAASSGAEYEVKADATQFIGASVSEVVKGQTKKASMIQQQQQRKGTAKKTDLPPPPLIDMRVPADTGYIEFTIVPLLLRANVLYDEANAYGESLLSCSEAEVKVVMMSPTNLVEDCKRCGIKLPANFEKNVFADMFWQQGQDKRKSFVYYKPAEEVLDDAAARGPRAASSSNFQLPSLQETRKSVDPNRFKVNSKALQDDEDEDICDELDELEQELQEMMRQEQAAAARKRG
ncbi:hypothetical protein BASA81_006593 [Batrachochytrium salamandrivorans]|nr:hypothetical protein BASA81_010617 [Batrachochytrium salamandrivorans]KAH9255474.1 hypothetical protein BASA81_006593 [Batrachochytrium salamandrivorans]